jgi:hypothetical protein
LHVPSFSIYSFSLISLSFPPICPPFPHLSPFCTFLQAPASFPLFLATAVLISLRDVLLARDASGCMVFFANVLAIDTTEVLRLALITFECTPPSFCAPVMALNDAARPLERALAAADAVRLQPVFFRTAANSGNGNGGNGGFGNDDRLQTLVAPRLSAADAMHRRQCITVVDVRSRAEHAAAQWPGALFVPYAPDSSVAAAAASASAGAPSAAPAAAGGMSPSSSANDYRPPLTSAELAPLIRLANRNYAEANFDAFLLVVGASAADEARFCAELIRNGISHVCVIDPASIVHTAATNAAASGDNGAAPGGWATLAWIAQQLGVSLTPPARSSASGQGAV